MTGSEPQIVRDRVRPAFPHRAVVTAGMPYGNKDLHFGHVGGVFIHADTLARFLRDRIGRDNVIFVSGTDCFGSAIVANYEKSVAEGGFSGDITAFVTHNHHRQKCTLDSYSIDLNLFAASALSPYFEIHRNFGAELLTTLHRNGHLQKRVTPQFFDTEQNRFLNGRQVTGHCPIVGCSSESAYADECSLGHQYEPSELINPISVLTGNRPQMRDVTNWYVPMQTFRNELLAAVNRQAESEGLREYAVSVLQRYFSPPSIYMKREEIEEHESLVASLPPHKKEPGTADSDMLVFDSLEAHNEAKIILSQNGCRYRSGPTLVPFRLTGNLEWGLPAPELEDLSSLTFWVWPESLWAPISFTAALLQSRGRASDDWKKWWCSKDAAVYQFIGEDNLFFYGLAESAMFLGMQGKQVQADPPEGQLQLPQIVCNRHLLFLSKKASSSGKVKPPMARDLLEFYTADQLRIHFLSYALGVRNVSFRPKPLDPSATATSSDPVLKEGGILTNAFNKAVRSCFYTVQKYFDRRLPPGSVSPDVVEQSEVAILDYEKAMTSREFHVAVEVVAAAIREINRRWTESQPFKPDCDPAVRQQALIDAFHMVRVAVVLLHPIAPTGTEKIREYLQVGEDLWDWNRIFEPLQSLITNPNDHQFVELPPKSDFFEKPACQIDG